jgi:uncharacterized protein (DUF2147 family)
LSTRIGFVVGVSATLVLATGIGAPSARAQGTAPAVKAAPAFGTLQGRWLRPDGGYVITIKSIDAGGKLDASYANPNVLPFAKAEASQEDGALRVFLELRAGGYDGSTYTLAYDPANDVLKGIYYQAVARQRYNVHFVRVK